MYASRTYAAMAMNIVINAKKSNNVLNLNSFSFMFYFSNSLICKKIHYIWLNKI